MHIYDVTIPISERMPVWPGEQGVRIEALTRIAKGDPVNTSRVNISSHAGTHVDAPYRYIQKGLTADRLPLKLLMGPAFVAEVDGLESNTIEVYDLAKLHFPPDTKRLLLKTSNSDLWQSGYRDFERDFIHLAPKTAEWLVKRNISLIGMDYLSVEAFGTKEPRVHHALLGAGVVILEGLDLSRVPPGRCELVCLPLKIERSDAAPARVLVIRS
jgi:arylformamidase